MEFRLIISTRYYMASLNSNGKAKKHNRRTPQYFNQFLTKNGKKKHR